MSTTAFTHRLTAAACAAIIAATFVGCASAADTRGSATGASVAGAGPGVARFVPDDNDPRGRHTVRVWVPIQVVEDFLTPLTGLTPSELRDRHAPQGGTSGTDSPETGSAAIDPRLTTAG